MKEWSYLTNFLSCNTSQSADSLITDQSSCYKDQAVLHNKYTTLFKFQPQASKENDEFNMEVVVCDVSYFSDVSSEYRR